jgi:crotonobetainyl-CoA:carnitine CoA-transferase CaiB-like acyl-CoA transferase
MLMSQPDWLNEFEDDWLEFSVTPEKVAKFHNGFSAWVRELSKDAASEEAQRLGVPLVPVRSAADLKNSPQYRHRGFFHDVTHPVLGAPPTPASLTC